MTESLKHLEKMLNVHWKKSQGSAQWRNSWS